MKSLLIASLFLIFPAVSFASHIPGHPSQENGDPQQVVQSWGLTGRQLKANGWIVAFPQFQYWANLAN